MGPLRSLCLVTSLAFIASAFVISACDSGDSGSAASALLDGGGGADVSVAQDAELRTDAADAADGAINLFPSDTTTVVATAREGFFPTVAGSTCMRADDTFTLTLAERSLTWKVCANVDGGSFAYQQGQTTLGESDMAALLTALHAIALTTHALCAEDKPKFTVTFTTSTKMTTYDDEAHACDNTSDGRTYVAGVASVLSAFAKLAAPAP